MFFSINSNKELMFDSINFNTLSELSDQDIVHAILNKDKKITYFYLYKKCYPIFNAVYRKYETDCESPIELINEIYVYIMHPNKTTGRCKLADFEFRCTFTLWIKIIVENYCRQLFSRKSHTSEEILSYSDRNYIIFDSIEIDSYNINKEDVMQILQNMPNERYRELIKHRYLEDKTNEETAMQLNISMENFYNSHKRAKTQFCEALRKEGLL